MDRGWLFVGVIVVFAVRDARLLGAARPRTDYLFAAVTLLVGCATGSLGAAFSKAAIEQWLAHPVFWGGALAVHLGLALGSLPRAGNTAAGSRVALAPSPVFVVALVLLARAMLAWTNALTGPPAGCIAAVGYLLLVAALRVGFKKISGSGRVAQSAAWSHLTAILLVPFVPFGAASTDGNAAQGNGALAVGEAGAGWAVALGVLLLVALSFGRHRRRSKIVTVSKSR